MSILLYGCATWTLTKRMEKKLDGNYTIMLRAILNKSWRQHPTKKQLCSHLPSITKIILVRRTRHAGNCWRIRTNAYMIYSCGPLQMGEQRQDDQLKPIYNSSVPILDIVLKSSREKWTIEKGGKRVSGRSVLAARHDDDIYLRNFIFGYKLSVMSRLVINNT